MKRITSALCVVFALSATFAGAAIDLNAIKPDGFAHGVVFTVDGYAANEDRATLTNFPVLVRISPTAISGFAYTDSLVSEGGDIRFADENGTAIPFEKDTWNTAGESLFWVTLPSMTNGTQFAMFYGTSASDANNFTAARHQWADYTGVWHMRETEDGSNKTIGDSTTNRLDGSTGASTSAYMAGGAVGGARTITTTGDSKNKEQISVSLTDSGKKAIVDALVPTFTVSLWYRLDSDNETNIRWDYLIGRRPKDKTNSSASGGWAIQMCDPSNSGTKSQSLRIWSNEGNEDCKCTRPAGFKNLYRMAQTWIKMDVVYDGAQYSLYTNGAILASGSLKGAAVSGTTTFLGIGGGAPSGNDIRPFTGAMDEVRLRPGTVDANWVAADYATQKNVSFLSAGSVETVAASTKPIAEFSILDIGAAFIQVSGKVNACGAGAGECVLYSKIWKDGETEPSNWTQLATGVMEGAAVTNFIVDLDPLTDYHYAFRAANDLATPEYSDTDDGEFTTSGVGEAGGGGTVERQLDELVHTFQPVHGVTATYSFTPPAGVTEVEALVVAGGGPGGYYAGGGGGGGGVRYEAALSVTPHSEYTITVGKGGTAAETSVSYGSNGDNSSIVGAGVNLVAVGGGAGGNGPMNGLTSTSSGQNGGSGGGSARKSSNAGTGTTGQGCAGAKGFADEVSQGGGGGGASEAGTAPVQGGTKTVTAGGGGNGSPYAISGSSVLYGGGGGGGGAESKNENIYGTGGGGGLGGGGVGGQWDNTDGSQIAESGTDGLGGGGGGGSTVSGYEKGGDGGGGVVIIRYGAGGDGVGATTPIISLHGASYNSTTHKGDLTFRVAWSGENYDYADVSVIWGYSASRLIYTNSLANAIIGAGMGSFQPRGDDRSIFCKVIAVNGGGETGVSAETLSFYVNDDGLEEEVLAPVLGPVALAHVDGLYAVVTGSLVSAGSSATAKVRVMLGSYSDILSEWTLTNGVVAGAFTLNVTGLATNTAYWYRVEAEDDAGLVAETAAVPFTTVGASAFPDTLTTSLSQRTLTVSGNLAALGAGTTYILSKVGDGEWTEVATFDATSDSTLFSVPLVGTWGETVTGYLMCSNTCELIDGTLVGEPYMSTRTFSIAPVDEATYTWQPVDGDWNGNWTNAAHWASDKADCRGYPNDPNASASFLDCTLSNPVVVDVDGSYAFKWLYCFGRAASDVTFAGASRSASSLSGKLHQYNWSSKPVSNSRVVFRDMALARADNCEIMRDKTTVTNITVRLDNVTSTGNNIFCLSAPYSHFEFVNGTTVSCKKMSIGGTDMVCLIDDSTITISENFWAPADISANAGLTVRFKGANPRITTGTGNNGVRPWTNSGGTVLFSFEVPIGGYAQAPIRMNGSAKFASGNSNNENTPKYVFTVERDSPALRQSHKPIANNVLVQTAAGIYTNNMVEGIGTVPVRGGAPRGTFAYGAGGSPLEAGQDPATDARQILLSLQGWGFAPSIISLH